MVALLNSIRTASTAVVTLGVDTANLGRPLDRYGYVVPRKEGGVVLASTWSSSKLEGRVPADRSLIRVFLGRDGDGVQELSDDELLALAREELVERLAFTGQPFLERVARFDHAMPQYDIGHISRVAKIRLGLETMGSVYIAGCSYDGVGIPDCIQSGWDAAEAILNGSNARAVGSNA